MTPTKRAEALRAAVLADFEAVRNDDGQITGYIVDPDDLTELIVGNRAISAAVEEALCLALRNHAPALLAMARLAVELRLSLAAAEAEVGRLREALRPFADIRIAAMEDATHAVVSFPRADFARARAALNPETKETPCPE